jgi:hypothetical protein
MGGRRATGEITSAQAADELHEIAASRRGVPRGDDEAIGRFRTRAAVTAVLQKNRTHSATPFVEMFAISRIVWTGPRHFFAAAGR